MKWLLKETVRVRRLRGCGPHRPEPKPFGQANLVALGPEIAQMRLVTAVAVRDCFDMLHILDLTSRPS